MTLNMSQNETKHIALLNKVDAELLPVFQVLGQDKKLWKMYLNWKKAVDIGPDVARNIDAPEKA